MAATRNATFAQRAEETYGPSSRPTFNTLVASDVEHLVNTQYVRDSPTSGLIFPSKQLSSQSSFRSTSPSLNHETHFTASTQRTTPEKIPRTFSESPATIKWDAPTKRKIWLDPTDFSNETDQPHYGFPPSLKNIWLRQTDSSTAASPSRLGVETTAKKAYSNPTTAATRSPPAKPEPELPPLEIDERLWRPDPIAVLKRYKSLSRVEQLEYFVKIKIEAFREHMHVHIPLYSMQSEIDEQEVERRRRFFKKNGEEAFRARYIDSDYTGCVEFLYIDPSEVKWKRIGRFGFWQT